MGFCCFGSVAEVGGRVSARRPRYLFFASPKKSTQKKGDPAVRVPSLRYGQPAMLEAGVRRRTPCAASARQLRSNSFGEPDDDARVSCGTRATPASALLGTFRRDWGPHTGHCFARPGGPSLRSARQSDRVSCVGSAQRVTNTRRGCQGSSRVVPASYPCWLRREAQELGWVHVPKDTCTSWSSSSMLSERSSKNAASSSTPTPDPSIAGCPRSPDRANGGRRLGVAFSLVTFSWRV